MIGSIVGKPLNSNGTRLMMALNYFRALGSYHQPEVRTRLLPHVIHEPSDDVHGMHLGHGHPVLGQVDEGREGLLGGLEGERVLRVGYGDQPEGEHEQFLKLGLELLDTLWRPRQANDDVQGTHDHLTCMGA